MPGGALEAWPHIKDIFQAVAAKSDGEPCCEWVHFYLNFILILIQNFFS